MKEFYPHIHAVFFVLICSAFVAGPSRAAKEAAKSPEGFGACSAATELTLARKFASYRNGWNGTLNNSRFQPAAGAGLTADSVARLRLKWAFGFEDTSIAFSQPTAAAGRLFVGAESGDVFALNMDTGCILWTFKAQASVRTGFVIGSALGRHELAGVIYFGDQHGAVYALKAASGQPLWKTQADPHPAAMITGTPQLWRGRLYVPVASSEENFASDPQYQCCTFRGSVVVYDAQTGRRVWQTYLIPDLPHKTTVNKARTQLWGPSGSGIWSAPTLDPRHRVLYVATGNNYSDPVAPTSDAVVAMNMDTGEILWTQQITPNDAHNASCFAFLDPTRSNCPTDEGSDFDFGASPIHITPKHGQPILVASQKSGVVYGLDPAKQGKVIWQTRIGKGGPLGGVEWGSAADEQNVYAALSDCDWKSSNRIQNGRTVSVSDLDPDKGGGLFALRLRDGHKVWESHPANACAGREHCSPAQLAAVTAIPGVVFSGSLDGHLRAYSSRSGEVLWDYGTASDFHTVNGVPAHGGSLNGASAAVVGGMVFVNSGYNRFGEAPGNVLLAFSLDGK